MIILFYLFTHGISGSVRQDGSFFLNILLVFENFYQLTFISGVLFESVGYKRVLDRRVLDYDKVFLSATFV